MHMYKYSYTAESKTPATGCSGTYTYIHIYTHTQICICINTHIPQSQRPPQQAAAAGGLASPAPVSDLIRPPAKKPVTSHPAKHLHTWQKRPTFAGKETYI